MASNKLTDGVGKKIVEALKMQSNEDFDLNNNNSPMMNNPEKIESNQSFEGFDNSFNFSGDEFGDVQPETESVQNEQIVPQPDFMNNQPLFPWGTGRFKLLFFRSAMNGDLFLRQFYIATICLSKAPAAVLSSVADAAGPLVVRKQAPDSRRVTPQN